MPDLTQSAQAAAAVAAVHAARAPQGGWAAAGWTLAGVALLAACLQVALVLGGRKLARRTKNLWDDELVKLLERYQAVAVLALGVSLAAPLAPLTADQAGTLNRGSLAAFLLILTLALAGFLSDLMRRSISTAGVGAEGASLSRTLVRLLVLGLGALMVLSQLGISVTPVLTALGVGSLAVALALQDTLSNLFAGFYVIASHQIGVGDYIRLDSGQEGHVDDVSWRSCRLKELNGNYILIPNLKLSQSIVTNYYRPQREISLVVNLGVAYSSDLLKVERVTCEVAREALQSTPGAIAAFEPFVRFNDFGEGAIKLSVILRIREYVDRYLLIHEFMKKVHARYRAEGIEMPAPQMDIHLVDRPRMGPPSPSDPRP